MLRQIWFDNVVVGHRFRSWRLPWILLEFRSFLPLGGGTRVVGGAARRTSRICISGEAATSLGPFRERCTRVTIACLFWFTSIHNKLLRLLLGLQICGRISWGWASLRPGVFDLLFVGHFIYWKLHVILLQTTRARLNFQTKVLPFQILSYFWPFRQRVQVIFGRVLNLWNLLWLDIHYHS